jgi:hypothetical protein
MRGYVKRGSLTRERFISLLRNLFPQKCYRLVHRADNCRIEFHNPGEAGWLADGWAGGRVFSPKAECRWEKVGADRFDVLVLAENDLDLLSYLNPVEPARGKWQVVSREGGRGGIYLWGDYRESVGHWVETRIPRPLSYPVERDLTENRFVQISHADYHAPNGAVQFTRFMEVV